ncbi:MAG: VOC family protein [Thermoleophilaceae bacterium]
MHFGYTILYVRDVAAALEFYERAFGQKRRFLHESGEYGELETGATTLAFAAHGLAAENLGEAFRAPEAGSATPFEVCFVTDDVEAGYRQALDSGAAAVSEPQTKPWGQDVAYVRDPEGTLVEIASPGA